MTSRSRARDKQEVDRIVASSAPFIQAAERQWAEGKVGSYLANIFIAQRREGDARRFAMQAGLVEPADSSVEWLLSPRTRQATARLAHVLFLMAPTRDKLRSIAGRFGAKKAKTKQAAVEALVILGWPWDNQRKLKDKAALTRFVRDTNTWAAGDSLSARVFWKARGGRGPTQLQPGQVVCSRCGGAGRIEAFRHIGGGVCFDCGGQGFVDEGL